MKLLAISLAVIFTLGLFSPRIAQSTAPEIRGFNNKGVLNVLKFKMNIPPEAQDGDLMINIAVCVPSRETNVIFAPKGWTFIRETHHAWYAYKIKEAGDPPAASWTWESGTKDCHGTIIAVTNFDSSNPIFSDNGLFAGSVHSTQLLAPTTMSVENGLLIYHAAGHAENGNDFFTIDPPTDMTELEEWTKHGTSEIALQVMGTDLETGDKIGVSNVPTPDTLASLIVISPAP